MIINAMGTARRMARLWVLLLTSCLWVAGCGDDDPDRTPTATGGGGSGAGGAAGGSTSTGGSTTTTSTGGTGGGASGVDVEGYWLWVQHIEDDEVVLQIDEEDLQISSQWEGCPSGIICTHYGIMKLAFGPTGQAHYIYNVTTSSDYQTPGTYSVDGDMLHYASSERFSCAHPNQDEQTESDRYAPVQLVDGNLWVGVTGFQGYQPPLFDEPTTEPTRWIVFRPISQAEFYGQYMIRVCQPLPDDPCHADCSSTSLIGE